MYIEGIKCYVNGNAQSTEFKTSGEENYIGGKQRTYPYGSTYCSVIKLNTGENTSHGIKLLSIKLKCAAYADYYSTHLTWAIRNNAEFQASVTEDTLDYGEVVPTSDSQFNNVLSIEMKKYGVIEYNKTYYIHIWPDSDNGPNTFWRTADDFMTSYVDIVPGDLLDITYDANSGYGGPKSQQVVSGESFKVPLDKPAKDSAKSPTITDFTITGHSQDSSTPDSYLKAKKSTKEGEVFHSWNANKDGSSSITWNSGATVLGGIEAPITMYAQYIPGEIIEYFNNKIKYLQKPSRAPTESPLSYFVITGKSNGGKSDSQVRGSKSSVTNYIFRHWRDSAGTTYSEDSEVEFYADTDLYAVYSTSASSDIYEDNTLDLLDVPERDPEGNYRPIYITGDANGGNFNTQLEGKYVDQDIYEFLGWSSSETGNILDMSTSYTRSVTVYAQWGSSHKTGYEDNSLSLLSIPERSKKTINTYTVSLKFDENPKNDTQYFSPVEEIYEFIGWSDSAGQPLSMDTTFEQSTTVYAQWSTSTYTEEIDLPKLDKEGYVFLGWKSPDGNVIKPGSWTPQNNVTLTAIYAQPSTCFIEDDDGPSLYYVYIDNGSSWDMYIPMYDNGSSWDV